MKKATKTTLIVFSVLLIIFVPVTIWVLDSSKPMSLATDAMETNELIKVTTEPWITFEPRNQTFPEKGYIFYPGGKVEPESYAPMAREIALAGYLVVIVPMPLNLAVLGANRANDVMAQFSNISTWVIGGHSLGGSMAAKFAFDNPEKIQGLILLASYPANSNNLSSYTIPTITIYGTLDSVVSKSIPDTLASLPSNTTIVAIQGGNHAYFGAYGEQKGDTIATISRMTQIGITVNYTISLLAEI